MYVTKHSVGLRLSSSSILRLGLLWAWMLMYVCSKIVLELWVKIAGLAQNPGPCGLGLFVYVEKP
jgi:hypothetical protein